MHDVERERLKGSQRAHGKNKGEEAFMLQIPSPVLGLALFVY